MPVQAVKSQPPALLPAAKLMHESNLSRQISLEGQILTINLPKQQPQHC